MITGFYAGLLAFGLAFLYLHIVKARRTYKISIQDGGNEDLARRVRIHGNFCETVPYLLLLLLMLELLEFPVWLLHIFGALIIVSRILNFYGLRSSEGGGKQRTGAGMVTIGLFITGACLLIGSYGMTLLG